MAFRFHGGTLPKRRAIDFASFRIERSIRSLGCTACALLVLACTSTGPAPACSPDKDEVPERDIAQAPAQAIKESPKEIVSDRFVRRGVVTFEQSSGLALGLPKTVTRSQVSSLVLPLSQGASVWVALDDHPARRVGARKLHLSDLLNEDEELAPGFHHLVVFKEEKADKMLLAVHAFSLDVESEAAPQAPPCILFTPQLTLNGPLAADSLTVLAIPLVPDVDRIRMRANGPDLASEAVVPVGTALGLSTPKSGDFVFSASCLSGDDVMLDVERAVTVNRDADWGAQSK